MFVVAGSTQAQQLETSAFYEMQGFMHNASLAGIGDNFVGVNYRTQWNNINGGPKTGTIYGSFALPKPKLGLSGVIFNDKTGPTSRTGLTVSIAKHILFDDKSILSLGIENRLQQFLLDQNKLIEYLGADPAVGNTNSKIQYNAGFGVSYTNSHLQLGVSVAQLIQSKMDNYTGNLSRTQEARLYRHYYANGSYKITSVDDMLSIIPNFQVIYFPNAPTEVNLGVRFNYNDIAWIGFGSSFTANVNFSFGLKLAKGFSLDYAFDLYNNPNEFYVNAHEFMLRYSFKK